MAAALGRIILYVQDVERLSEFYRQAFAFALAQHIDGEWAVLDAGACELAVLKAGPAYRGPVGAGGENVPGPRRDAPLHHHLQHRREESRPR